MELMIDIPEKVIARAAELKVPVEALVLKTLNDSVEEPLPSGFVRLGFSTKTPQQAAESIREIRSRSTLGGLKIKDLIEEGRPF